MAKEFHTCTGCGRVSTIFATNRREAERKLEWWKRNRPICNDCQGRKEYEAAREKASALELPPLRGTTTQVVKGEYVRTPFLASLMRQTEGDDGFFDADEKQISLVHLCTVTDASWWCAMYGSSYEHIIQTATQELAEARRPGNDPALQEAIDFETTLRPENPKSELIADFFGKAVGPCFDLLFPEKNDDFNEAVKAFSPRWNPSSKRWNFKFPQETFPDIAAEVIAHVVGSGFPVRIRHTDIREMAAAGTFQKSDGRRIDYAGKDHFRVEFRRIDGDYYDEVRKIVNSKWDRDNQTVLVHIGSADDLRDFAKKFGFPMTELAVKACEAFDEYRSTGMIQAKKREKGKAAPVLDPVVFPDVIKIDPSLLA